MHEGEGNSLMQALQIPPHDLELGRMLGRGSMGSVYVGDWVGTPVAVKVMNATDSLPAPHALLLPIGGSAGAPADCVPHLSREAAVLARLRHPCLCSFFGIVNVHGGIGVVFELMTGGSLATLLLEQRPGCIEAPIAARIARDVAVGLAYLHRNGITHRDIKAANVMLTEGLRAKVADFGLSTPDARAGQTTGHVAPAGHAGMGPNHAGAQRYMAPELISRGNDEPAEPCRKRSDVFSYGVLLFELMAPEPLVTPAAVPKRVPFSTDWRPELRLAEGLEPFEPLISWAWDEEPQRRPTMAELVAAIAQTGLAPPLVPSPEDGRDAVEGVREEDASRRLSEALWGSPDEL